MKLGKDDDFYTKVMKHITKVREQGEPPRSDVFELDTYICDLCKGSITKENITQCPFCGRWICKKNCWDSEQMACTTCVGVIKLCRESVDKDITQSKIEAQKHDKKKSSDIAKKVSNSEKLLGKLVKKKSKSKNKRS
jgi:hypothetical protein